MGRTRITMTGGDRMARELARIGQSLDANAELRVGFLEGATYPNEESLPVAQVAFWNEFGTSRAPARPFFREMIDRRSPRWGNVIAANLEATGYDVKTTFNRLGQVIKDQLTQSIVEFSEPGNAPYTIAKKGFDNPLIDTGVMQRMTGFEVGVK